MNAANQSVLRATEPYTPARMPEKSSVPLAIFIFSSARHHMIAQNAYYRAERRGFQPGRELDDWLCAEHEVDSACEFL
jgi:Protein of unknown function (DUF2934)